MSGQGSWVEVGPGVSMQGWKEYNDALKALPDKIIGHWTNLALYRGVKALRGIARNEVPNKTGELSKTIRVGRSKRIDENRRAYFLVAGNRKKGKGYYAGWVHYGTKPHRIEATNRGALYFGGQVRQYVNHPGAKANPFMERTLRTGESAALRGFTDYLSDKLRQEGLINIQAEENAE